MKDNIPSGEEGHGGQHTCSEEGDGGNIPSSEEGHQECFDGADAGVEGKASKKLLVDVHGDSVNFTLSGLTISAFSVFSQVLNFGT